MSTQTAVPVIQPDTVLHIPDDTCVTASSIIMHDEMFVICDPFMHRLLWVDKSGAVVRHAGQQGTGDGQFRYPTCVCVDDDGNLWITDRWNHRVVQLDSTGNLLRSFGSYGENAGQFSEPWGIGFHDGMIYVADRNNHRIQVFDMNGTFQHSFGCSGPDKSYFESSEFKKGFSYSTWFNKSNRFDTVETCFFKEQYVIGNMEYPCGVSISPGGDIFVVDTGNDRIQQFSAAGELKSSIMPGAIIPDTDFLLDVRCIDDATLLVSFELCSDLPVIDSSGAVSRILRVPDGARLSHMGSNGSIVYAIDSWNKTIYLFPGK